MSEERQETVVDIVAEKEAEIARLKAALAASNDELALARSNSRAMYHRLNSENIRISEMDRETIHGLRAENARLRAALNPALDIVMDSATSDLSMEMAINEAKRIYGGSQIKHLLRMARKEKKNAIAMRSEASEVKSKGKTK